MDDSLFQKHVNLFFGLVMVFVVSLSFFGSPSLAKAAFSGSVFISDAKITDLKNRIANQTEPQYSNWINGVKAHADYALGGSCHAPSSWTLPDYSVDQTTFTNMTGDLIGDTKSAYSLALAYRITGNESYAVSAASMINCWANTVSSLSTVNGGDLIWSYSFPKMIWAADLIKNSPNFSSADQNNFKNFVRYKSLPENSMQVVDNWGDWGLLLVTSTGAYLQDQTIFNQAVDNYKFKIEDQISNGGEYRWGMTITGPGQMWYDVTVSGGYSGIHYSVFEVLALTASAEIMKNNGVDLFNYVSPSNHSLQEAYNVLTGWQVNPSTFPYTYTTYGVSGVDYVEILNQLWPSSNGNTLLNTYRPVYSNEVPFLTFTHGGVSTSVSITSSPPPPPPPPPSTTQSTTATCGTDGSICASSLSFATTPTNGWGPVELNTSNGESASGDGRTITLNGVTYSKGLGTHANSEITYNLNGQYSSFLSDIGVDDEEGSNPSTVDFQVWTDGSKIYDSGTMTGSTATKQVNLSTAGKNQLKLIVTDAGDGQSYDHADWANARMIQNSTTTPPPSTSAKFSVGDRIVINITGPANVRQSPSGTVLGTQSIGNLGTVVGGPTDALLNGSTVTWYQIDYDNGVDGWSGDGLLDKSTSSTPVPTTTTTSASTKFSINDRIQTNATVNVRSDPNTISAATLLGTQSAGAIGTVVGGPVLGSDSINRWNINFDSGLDGWVGEDYLTKYTNNNTTSSTSSSCNSIGSSAFSACYYDNQDFTGTLVTRTDQSINFDWGNGSPDPSIGADTFSARWQGDFSFNSGTYTFSATADDGIRLYVDNVLQIDKWFDQGATTYTQNVTLTSGTHRVKVEYYENGGGASAQVSWTQAGAVTSAPPPTTTTSSTSCPSNSVYVAKNGSNTSGTGTQSNPYLTIAKGLSVLTEGGTLCIRAGTYDEGNLQNIPGGSSWSSPTIIRSYQNEKVVIAPSARTECIICMFTSAQQYIVVDGLVFDGTNIWAASLKLQWTTPTDAPQHIRTQNSEFINTGNAKTNLDYPVASGSDSYSSDIQFVHNKIIGGSYGAGDTACGQSKCYGYPLYWSGSNGLIEGNEIYNFPSYGIHLYCSGCVPKNNIVRNNIVHDFGWGDPRGTGIILTIGGGDNNVAYNNIVYNGTTGIIVAGSNSAAYNNTVYNMSNAAYSSEYTTNAQFTNNVAANSSQFFWEQTSEHPTYTKNLCTTSGTGCNLTGNPLFVSTSDFHLQSNSPAINSGTTVSQVTTDIEGATRPVGSAYDIGAYEYGGVVTSGTAPLSGWTSCATEGGTCSFSGTKEVQYGANGSYVSQTLSNGTACTNAVFGDPLSGIVKYCYYRDTQTSFSTKFTIGDRVQATATVNVRSSSSISATSLGTQVTGNLGTVVGGGAYAEGYYWWNINYDNGLNGWSAEDYLGKYTTTSPTTSSTSCPSNSYYVSTNGNDSNSGTISSPFRTIQKGINTATPGNTICVRGGTYTEALSITKSGQSGNSITLENYPGEAAKIQAPDKGQFVITMMAQSPSTSSMGWWIIRGFEITGGQAGIRINALHDSLIQGNYIHDNDLHGIIGAGVRMTIDGNKIYHNGYPCSIDNVSGNQCHGMYINGSDWIISNNQIYANKAYGIQIAAYPYDPTEAPTPDYGGATRFIVANNTIAYEVNRSGIVVWQSGATNNTFENNILYQNAVGTGGTYGIDFYNSGGGNVVKNNVIYSNAGGTAISDTSNGGSYSVSGSITSDPNFVNGSAYDFHLQSSSPAINSGTTVSQVTTDIEGSTRPVGSAYDIGAYEYGGTVTTTTPPPTTISTKFGTNDRIYVANGPVNVRATGGGTVLAQQQNGSQGTVIGGPIASTIQGSADTTTYNWWNINFDSGVDGWVGEGPLEKVTTSTTVTPPTSSTGNIYYVSAGGHNDSPSDNNSCASAKNILTPKLTINNFLENCTLSPGDTLYIRGGTYAEGVQINMTGTASNYITVSSYPNETAVIRPPDSTFALEFANAHYIEIVDISNDCTNLSNNTCVDLNFGNPNVDHVHFIRGEVKNVYAHNSSIGWPGCTDPAGTTVWQTIRGNASGFNGSGPSNVGLQIIGTKFYHNAAHGLYMSADGAVIDGIESYENCFKGGQFYPGGNNITLKNSSIHDNKDEGWVFTYGSGNSAINNIFYSNYYAGLNLWGGQSGDTVLNNTFYGNATHGSLGTYGGLVINGNQGGTGSTIKNNLAYLNASFDMTTVNESFSNNLYGVDPKFVSTTQGSENFHLQSNSPAIDTGTAVSSVTTDIEGSTRPVGSAYDIGAYEYGGTPITTTTSNKFVIGARVQINATGPANVRQTPAGSTLGTQSIGNIGTVVGGPTSAVLNGTTITWWQIDFDSSFDGWVGENLLDKYTGSSSTKFNINDRIKTNVQ